MEKWKEFGKECHSWCLQSFKKTITILIMVSLQSVVCDPDQHHTAFVCDSHLKLIRLEWSRVKSKG